jgi:superfamily I DNA/RNA helicase
LLEYAESPMGGDIRYILNAIKKYGFAMIISSLNKTEESANEAEITITTVHKAKGLEWKIVKLANDFSYPEIGENIAAEEVNILYVAVTRALEVLITHNCDALHPDNLAIGVENWEFLLRGIKKEKV